MLKKLVRVLYARVFGHDPSNEGFSFLRKLSWSFIGVISSGLILFWVGIGAGRLLGPTEYGNYSLAISIATIVSAVSVLGFDIASVRYIAVSDSEEEKKAYYSNALWVLIGSFLFLAIVYFSFGNLIADKSRISKEICAVALGYALVLALRQTTEAYIRGLGLFKQQAIVKIVESSATLALFVGFYVVLRHINHQTYIAVLSGAGLLSVAIYCVKLLGNPLQRWNRQAYLKARMYALSSIFTASVGIFVINIDYFFLNHALGATEVGIFSAYTLVPSMMVNYMSTGIVNVFFPIANRLNDKQSLLRQLNKLALWGFLPVVMSIAVAGVVVLLLFGSKYPIVPVYIAEISIFGYFQLYLALIAAIVGSSESMYRSYVKLLPVKLAVITGSYLFLVALHMVSIFYLLAMMSVVAIFDIFLFLSAYKKNLHEHSA